MVEKAIRDLWEELTKDGFVVNKVYRGVLRINKELPVEMVVKQAPKFGAPAIHIKTVTGKRVSGEVEMMNLRLTKENKLVTEPYSYMSKTAFFEWLAPFENK